jgi:4'-phosphopantetheinyl transferase
MVLTLASNEVHLWCLGLDLSEDEAASFYGTLSPDEQSRSARFRFDRDRQRFIVAHGALREVLGCYVGTRPGDLRFVHNEFGKPALAPEFDFRPRFNLSHSAELALIAIAADADVGVDVERVRAEADYAEIAKRFFSTEEVDELNRVPGHLHAEAFLGCWTRKEAYLKARGEGFAIAPESFSAPRLDGAWSLLALQPAPGYVGALAIERGGWRLRKWHWRTRSRAGPSRVEGLGNTGTSATGPAGAAPGWTRRVSRGARGAHR